MEGINLHLEVARTGIATSAHRDPTPSQGGKRSEIFLQKSMSGREN